MGINHDSLEGTLGGSGEKCLYRNVKKKKEKEKVVMLTQKTSGLK